MCRRIAESPQQGEMKIWEQYMRQKRCFDIVTAHALTLLTLAPGGLVYVVVQGSLS